MLRLPIKYSQPLDPNTELKFIYRYFVGSDNETELAQLQIEQATYEDLVILKMKGSYQKLRSVVLMSLYYATHEYSRNSELIKMDDDSFVRFDHLPTLFRRVGFPDRDQEYLAGFVGGKSKVTGVWFRGCFYVLSAKTARYIAKTETQHCLSYADEAAGLTIKQFRAKYPISDWRAYACEGIPLTSRHKRRPGEDVTMSNVVHFLNIHNTTGYHIKKIKLPSKKVAHIGGITRQWCDFQCGLPKSDKRPRKRLPPLSVCHHSSASQMMQWYQNLTTDCPPKHSNISFNPH